MRRIHPRMKCAKMEEGRRKKRRKLLTVADSADGATACIGTVVVVVVVVVVAVAVAAAAAVAAAVAGTGSSANARHSAASAENWQAMKGSSEVTGPTSERQVSVLGFAVPVIVDTSSWTVWWNRTGSRAEYPREGCPAHASCLVAMCWASARLRGPGRKRSDMGNEKPGW